MAFGVACDRQGTQGAIVAAYPGSPRSSSASRSCRSATGADRRLRIEIHLRYQFGAQAEEAVRAIYAEGYADGVMRRRTDGRRRSTLRYGRLFDATVRDEYEHALTLAKQQSRTPATGRTSLSLANITDGADWKTTPLVKSRLGHRDRIPGRGRHPGPGAPPARPAGCGVGC